MKTIPAPLQAHYEEDVTTVCLLAKVECRGLFTGLVFGFTNLDIDITYDDDSGDDPLLYESANGFVPKQSRSTATGDVDNSEITGVIGAAGITENMIRAGLFRSARVTVYRVNYEDLTAGRHEVVDYGRAGQSRYRELDWDTELRSLKQMLRQTIGMVYSIPCNWRFGDANCTKAFVWVPGTVTSLGSEPDLQFGDSSDAEADGHFTPGAIRVLTGDNAGAEGEIEQNTTGVFALSLPLPYPLQIGDTFERRQDCDFSIEMCVERHNNKANHGGFPLMPVDGTAMVPGAEIERR